MYEKSNEVDDKDNEFRLKNLIFFFYNNEIVPHFKEYMTHLRVKIADVLE